MTSKTGSTFVYATFIRTTPEKLWAALTDPETMKRYWFDTWQDCDWKAGSPWRLIFPDGSVADSGRILEIEPLKRIVIEWQNHWRPEIKAEGPGRCTYEIEAVDDGAVKLTITHTSERADSELIKAVSSGWPKVLSNLKSFLETGAEVLKKVPLN